MTAFDIIEEQIDATPLSGDVAAETRAATLLALGENVLENWLIAHEGTPTDEKREGFRLLALHRQAAKGDPSFNACRETCRELVYYHNLIVAEPDHPDIEQRIKMASLVARHLCYFISGKLQSAELGEFCCSSKPIRTNVG